MKAREMHQRAMDYLQEADSHALIGNQLAEHKALRHSYELELKAAEYYIDKFESEPTRSILYKGAGIIALRLREWRAAEQHIATALTGNPPEDVADQLRNVLENVYFTRHLASNDTFLSTSEIELCVAGNAVGFGVVRKDFLFHRIEAFQKMLYRTAEHKLELPYRTSGMPTTQIRKDYTIFLGSSRAASYGIALRVGSEQLTLPSTAEIESVLSDTLRYLQYFEDDHENGLRESIKSEDFRSAFIRLAKELQPDGTNISYVHFALAGEEEPRHVSLRKTRTTTTHTKPTSVNYIDEPETVTITGELRLLDSLTDRERFSIMSEDGQTHKINAPSSVMEDILPFYYKHKVAVTAQRIGKSKLVYLDLHKVEE